MDPGDAALVEKLKAMKEWSRAMVFNDEGHALASTFSANEAEIKYERLMLPCHLTRL